MRRNELDGNEQNGSEKGTSCQTNVAVSLLFQCNAAFRAAFHRQNSLCAAHQKPEMDACFFPTSTSYGCALECFNPNFQRALACYARIQRCDNEHGRARMCKHVGDTLETPTTKEEQASLGKEHSPIKFKLWGGQDLGFWQNESAILCTPPRLHKRVWIYANR